MSEPREHWYAYEVESFLVVLLCVGMMAFGTLFYVVGKIATHQAFARCLAAGCESPSAEGMALLHQLQSIEAGLNDIRAYMPVESSQVASRQCEARPNGETWCLQP